MRGSGATGDGVRVVRFAYADPPYVGQARKHYGPDAKEVNHRLLIAHLNEFDGWALSCSSPSLRGLLPLCPDDVRICPWVKPFCAFKKNVTRAYAWEPVIVRGGRAILPTEPTVRDFVSASITLGRGTHGAKPNRFCRWLFAFLGVDPIRDEFIDLFPGSGAVWAAYEEFRREHEHAVGAGVAAMGRLL